MKGRAWTRKEYEDLCKAYRWVSKDSVKGSSQTSEGVWTLLNTQSRHDSGANYYNEIHQAEELYMDDMKKPFSCHVGDEQGSPIIQEIRVENPSPDESSIPRPTGQNKAQKLKENGKAKNDLAFREEMTSSLRLMVEQNAFATEERKHRHEERAKQIQEEMANRNMQRNTSEGKLWPNRSCLYPTILLQWWMKMTIIVFKMKLL
ncbi:hypothetical protein D8674_024863 [Pyrus ussuriensis x Pyrus communis]|uniref:No apical meristem-associated C-terminal domain-containing protein n=1 Tax=Pyrus ussuriensis x Pyrus communis TaxID=2448454 RepID=A0A5N5H933_9ROSA|nr:hypothetical protein D8674_024863 [Pyrus ussuriensis x Pyrus communis]